MVGKTKITSNQPPLRSWRRTKILATIGPATDSYEAIYSLIKNGANGLRLNFSHGTYEERTRQIEWIRRASKTLNIPVAIIQDLQGPKIRLGDFDGVIEVTRGQTLALGYEADYQKTGVIPTQFNLAKKVKRGERLLLFDGRIHTVISSVREGVVYVEAQNSGQLIRRKGINVPDTNFKGDVITAKDRQDLVFASNLDIDYVALSFVQSAEDVVSLKHLLKGMNFGAGVIAKIETAAAVSNIEEIVEASDMVMIARGDLAVETPAESIPIVQRQIVGLGRKHAVPTIVATQMLISMTTELEPSRAEVSDIASAVIIGADCLMLSEETASGEHPIEAVKTMAKVIRYTERHNPLNVTYEMPEDHSMQAAISEAAIKLSETIKARAIVAETKSGATARNIAARRVGAPLIAVTSDKRSFQQLALTYGVQPYLRPADKQAAQKLTDWLKENKVLEAGDIVVTASGKYPGVVGTTDTIKVRVLS